MNYKKIDTLSQKNHNFSFWQSLSWKEILQKSHQAEDVFYFGNLETTFFLVEIRAVGMGFFGAFVLGLKKSQISHDYESCFEALKNFLRKKKIIFLQVEPLDDIGFSGSFFEPNKKFLTPFTRIISLHKTIDEILQNMHQKGRYAVRNAIKKGVEIEVVDQFSSEILDNWMLLLDETTKRDNFFHNSREYYEYFLTILDSKAKILSARFDGEIIAMIIMVFSGKEAIYYYGASSSNAAARKLASSYLLLLKAMELAKGEGKEIFDLLGVADPKKKNDPLAGVSQFKEKLGGILKELPKKFLFPLSMKFYIYWFVVKVKNFCKK